VDALKEEAHLNQQLVDSSLSPADILVAPGPLKASDTDSTAPPDAIFMPPAAGDAWPVLARKAELQSASASTQQAPDLGELANSANEPGAQTQFIQQPSIMSQEQPLQHLDNDRAQIGAFLRSSEKAAPTVEENEDGDVEVVVSASTGTDDITATRPGAVVGQVDTVSFGLFAKNFFGTSLKTNKFTLDAVMALKWTDSRVAALVPAGMDKLSMSGKKALQTIWMPEIVITNRDIRKHEIVSSSVTIFKTGEVQKVERQGVICNQLYKLADYPFDMQKLELKIASSKYMLDEVVLAPDEDKSSSGANDGLMKGQSYELDSWKVYAFEETDGALKKSRGVLQLNVERRFDKYGESHVMPTLMLLVISWGVFWFPFQNPFITPRLALSVLALLAFTNLMLKSSSALPDGAPNNLNDTFNQQIQAMMFCTIVLNIFSEFCKHTLKVEHLATDVNNQAKALVPCLSIVIVILVLTAGEYKWMSLGVAGIVTKVITLIVIGSYMTMTMGHLSAAREEQALEEEEARRKKEAGP
jgi:hypothetical protein